MTRLMTHSFWLAAMSAVVIALPAAAEDAGDSADANRYWAQWRGPLSTGVAPHGDPPVEWSETQNIRWKTALPGNGHSTPVVWGDRIFVTAAIPYGEALEPRYNNAPGAHDNLPVTHQHKFVVLAVDRRDGKILWQCAVHQELPHEAGHVTGSLASASPITDGENVFAFFGSHGLYCLDLEGKVQWQTNLGQMQTKHAHGEGSSPALYGDTLIVNWDHEGQSFVIALDKRTGKQRWKLMREQDTSWGSPLVVEHAGRPQVVISGTNSVRSYDLATGDVIWQCAGLSSNVIATPVSADGMLYAGSSYDTRNMLGIRLAGAKGDITGTDHVVWSRRRATPYVPSPLLYDDWLYFLGHYQGILSRVRAKTGEEPVGPFRLNGISDVYASPVAAAGRVYITDRDGATLVLAHGEVPRVLAFNQLEDSFSASAAIVGRELFLRGQRHLYCISDEKITP